MSWPNENQPKVVLETLRRQYDDCVFFGSAQGEFYMGDNSFPKEPTHHRKSWRCVPFSRIGLLISGLHEIAFIRDSTIIEACMKPGDMWFFPIDTHDDEMFGHRCQYVSVVFFESYTRFVIVNNEGPTEIYPAPLSFHMHIERPPSIQATLAALNGLPRQETSTKPGAHLCRALWQLLFEWLQSGEAHDPPSIRKAAATWMAVDRIIQENYHRPMNRQTVAERLHIHPNWVSEVCREFGGDTFQHLLEQRRIRQAKRFLENSDTKIEALAVMCGFSGAPYFTRAFGRATGMAPGEWRRRQGKQR